MWLAVLIAVFLAASSGFFGASLGAWNDRNERFRDRMISAADDVTQAGAEALNSVRDAIYNVRNELPPEKRIGRAWEKRDPVLISGARVSFLFGPDSETARAVDGLTRELGRATDKAQGKPPDLDAADAALDDAKAKLQDFARVALKEIPLAKPPSARMRDSFWRSLRRSR